MISIEEAERIATAHIGPDCGLIASATREKPYGWYFQYQSRAWLASGDDGDMLIGSSGFLVEREDGRLFEFGSAYPAERWLECYERGFKYDRYDLVVRSVSDPPAAITLLDRLDMTCVVPELEGGTVWVIPRPYTAEELREMIGQLPCVFPGQAFWHRVEVFDEIDATGCMTYELREHRDEG